MRTTWTLLALSAAGLSLWGGIVAAPWAVAQEATTPREQPAAAINVIGTAVAAPSDPFGQPMAYSMTYPGHEAPDPVVAKARQMERKLQHQAREFLAQYANTEDADKRATIKKALGDLLTQQFELQKEVREKELSRLEEKVKKLRDLLDKRSGQREEIVQRRVDQLVIEAECLGWVDSPATGFFEGSVYHTNEAFAPAVLPPLPSLAPTPAAAPAPPTPVPPTNGVR